MEWQTAAEVLCRLVATDDLEGKPVYLLDFSELVEYDSRLHGGNCGAWTSRFCDLILCDFLSNRGRWNGRGFAAVFHVDMHGKNMPLLLGSVLHELAHFLTADVPKAVVEPQAVSLELLDFLPREWSQAVDDPPPVEP